MEVLVDVKPRGRMADEACACRNSRREMQECMEQAMPTVVFGATQPIQMRVEELISGVRATLALKVYGEDLDNARSTGRRRSRPCWARCPAWPICRWRPTRASRRLVVKVNREAAARYGINADEILEVVQAGIGGEAVSTLIDGVRRFDIQVRLDRRVPRQRARHRQHPDPHPGRRVGAAVARGHASRPTKATHSSVASSSSVTR